MTATKTAPSPPQAARRREDPRIVTGDRFCTQCGYNLIGQQVVREEHYALLIVRCPECATVASVQEYPLLGGWAVRWGVVLAVLWFIFLVGMWPASSGIVCGMSITVTDEASRTYSRHLDALFAASQTQTAGQPAPGPGGRIVTIPGGTISFGPGSGNFGKWWQQQDHKVVLDAAGGWRGAVDGDAFFILIPAGLLVFGVGWFWSVCLIQLKRRWLIVCAAAIMLLAIIFVGPIVLEWQTHSGVWTRYAANQQLGLTSLALSMGFCVIALGLGLWLGRPLTRLGVRALLPPRLRSSLGLLWTAEGLAPPATR
ncbi:MAG: hypothetical protein ACYSWT_18510 [Planctomycetota bacterium]|jgi:hypothetical protein